MHFLFKKLSSSSSSAIVLFSLIAFVLFSNTNAVIKLPGNATIPAIIAFGDSIMDTGNNNHLKTLGKCNFRPYGRAFIGKKLTGRWTNGKAPTDLIVLSLSLSLSAFLVLVFFQRGLFVFYLYPKYAKGTNVNMVHDNITLIFFFSLNLWCLLLMNNNIFLSLHQVTN